MKLTTSGRRTLSVFISVALLTCSGATVLRASTDIRSRIESQGRFFSIEVREAELSDVLRALAQQSGLNVILGSGIAGKVTLSFKQITFKDALEVILRANGLGYTIRNNVVWIDSQENIAKVGDELDETSIEVMRLNYADPSNVANQVKALLSEKGSVQPDKRTNSLIVKDTNKKITEIKKLIEALDIQLAQVIIEARIVEASTTFVKQLGVRWGGSYNSGGTDNVSVGGTSLFTDVLTSGENIIVDVPATSPTSAIGFVLGGISNDLILDIELSAAERNGDLTIISQPRIATLNNQTATIHSGLTYNVKISQTLVSQTTTSTSTDQLQEVVTGIDLTVTPHITSDGFVILDIKTEKSEPDFSHTVDGIPGIIEKSASTNVIVKDGETVVIGGLYKSTASSQNDSVPVLKNIPFLGWLFKSHEETKENEELLVFITPTIVRYGAEVKEVAD